MMQTFTKNELKWIREALLDKVHEAERNIEAYPNGIAHGLAQLWKENYQSVADKINQVLAEDSKRIGIE